MDGLEDAGVGSVDHHGPRVTRISAGDVCRMTRVKRGLYTRGRTCGGNELRSVEDRFGS